MSNMVTFKLANYELLLFVLCKSFINYRFVHHTGFIINI